MKVEAGVTLRLKYVQRRLRLAPSSRTMEDPLWVLEGVLSVKELDLYERGQLLALMKRKQITLTHEWAPQIQIILFNIF